MPTGYLGHTAPRSARVLTGGCCSQATGTGRLAIFEKLVQDTLTGTLPEGHCRAERPDSPLCGLCRAGQAGLSELPRRTIRSQPQAPARPSLMSESGRCSCPSLCRRLQGRRPRLGAVRAGTWPAIHLPCSPAPRAWRCQQAGGPDPPACQPHPGYIINIFSSEFRLHSYLHFTKPHLFHP